MVRRNTDEELRTDVIVDIPKERERQFGCSGKMLKPSRRSVESLVKEIPRGRLMTTTLLRQTLAKRHGVQVTCPFLTKRALLAIAADPETAAPFWRIVMPNGEMIAAYPGGGSEQARHLEGEGVRANRKSGKWAVVNVRESLATP